MRGRGDGPTPHAPASGILETGTRRAIFYGYDKELKWHGPLGVTSRW